MKEDKIYVLRKVLVVVSLILLFVTAGIITVSLQVKTIKLNYFGNIQTIKTMSNTVEGFLLQNRIYIGGDMIVSPSVDSVIENDMEIKIYSSKELGKLDIYKMQQEFEPVVAKIVEVVDIVPYEEEIINNPTINRGTSNVKVEGSNGEKITKYLVKSCGEKEILKLEIEQVVTKAAEKKVIEVGTKLNPYVSRSAAALLVDNGFKQYNINLPVEQQKFTYNLCKDYGIQYELFLSTMYKESGYNPNAIGGGNSYGLSQIHISNHAMLSSRLGITNFLDPYENIKAGIYMLSLYLDSARKIVSDDRSIEVYALNSYNMGEGAYYTTCYSNGILDRAYSNSILAIRDRLIANGGL
jgi:hypothetical protein